MKKRLFTEKQVGISAVLAGPVPPGILIYLNYLRLGKARQAHIALAITFVFTLLFFFSMMFIPEEVMDKIPNFVFSSFYGLVVYFLYRHFMGDEVKMELEAGREKASNWTVTGVTILGLALNLALIFGLAFSMPPFPGEEMSFKGNSIYYDQEQITKLEVEQLAQQLFDVQYFGEGFENAVHLAKTENGYMLTMPVPKEFWTDPEIENLLNILKNNLKNVLGSPISIVLEHYDFAGKTKKKKI